MSLLRSSIEFSNVVVGRIRADRRVNVSSGSNKVCLNLGCGLTVTKGWVNIDGSLNALISTMPRSVHRFMYRFTGAKKHFSEVEYCRLLGEHVFVHHNLAFGIPVNDAVADYIFTSHFLEHLFYKDAMHLLRESYRVLKVGATLRISIPDLEYAVSLYHSGEKEDMLRKYFFVDDEASNYARHKYMYDFSMISEILSEIGFREIRRCEFRQGRVPDIDLLDNRPGESLFVEATK